MKKRRLKIKNIVIFLLFICIIIVVIPLLKPKSDFQVTLKNVEINYGSEYEPIFTATYKGSQVTSKVTYENNIDTQKLGKQKINFIYQTKDVTIKTEKTVTVKDLEAPVITLKRGEHLVLLKDSEFVEPGYSATDNLDGDISNRVKVSGKVNTAKEGTYTLTYIVQDKTKNKTEIQRIVEVTSDSPIDQDIKEFSLNGYFEDVILKETKDYGSEYTDSFIFAGDSMALYYVINGLVPGKRLWHQISINPETALTSSIYINHIDTGKTFVENLKEKEPKKMIFTLGTNGAAYMKTEYFIECYRKLLEKMQKASPETLIIVQSIPPVDSKYDNSNSGINNQKINNLNYYIAQICSELNIPFLNSAEAMKDENGACKKGYCIEKDGIHPTKEGQTAMLEYMQTHAYIK